MSEALKLQFVGQEKLRKKSYTIIDENVELSKYEDGYVKSGCYSFPFSIQLPETLPGTFKAHRIQIKYKLQATMNPLKGTKVAPLVFKTPIVIYDNRENSDLPIEIDHDMDVSRWIFKTERVPGVKTKIDKSLFYSDELIQGVLSFVSRDRQPKKAIIKL